MQGWEDARYRCDKTLAWQATCIVSFYCIVLNDWLQLNFLLYFISSCILNVTVKIRCSSHYTVDKLDPCWQVNRQKNVLLVGCFRAYLVKQKATVEDQAYSVTSSISLFKLSNLNISRRKRATLIAFCFRTSFLTLGLIRWYQHPSVAPPNESLEVRVFFMTESTNTRAS